MLSCTEIEHARKNLFLQELNYATRHKLTFVYVLKDPRTDVVLYVGSTSDPTTRLTWHLKQPQKTGVKTAKQKLLDELQEVNLNLTWDYIDVCHREEAKAREQWWIEHYRKKGEASLNERNAVAKPKIRKTNKMYYRLRKIPKVGWVRELVGGKGNV